MPENKYEIYAETPDKQCKKEYWEAAIGLQQVDGLEPSKYLIDLAQQNVDGTLSYQEVETLLYSRYESETPEEIKSRQRECDLVSGRITQLLDSPGYPIQPASLKAVHKYLFKDLIDSAGSFRTCNIYKKEPVLNGQSVKYTNFDALEETLAYDFEQEKQKSYAGLSPAQTVKRIAEFTSAVWQAHPFMEGDARVEICRIM